MTCKKTNFYDLRVHPSEVCFANRQMATCAYCKLQMVIRHHPTFLSLNLISWANFSKIYPLLQPKKSQKVKQTEFSRYFIEKQQYIIKIKKSVLLHQKIQKTQYFGVILYFNPAPSTKKQCNFRCTMDNDWRICSICTRKKHRSLRVPF